MVSETMSEGQDSALKVSLLEESFEKIKPQANEFVVSFYDNLFTDYPAAKPLFAHANMEQQGKKLLMSLVFVIDNLRQPEALAGALKGLGARHVKYGALPEHYPLVGSSLLKTFGQYLGPDWTPTVQQAWIDAYGAITEIMLEGADYDKASVQMSGEPAAPVAPASNVNLAALAAVLVSSGAIVGLALLLI